jgi:hypothetical protein
MGKKNGQWIEEASWDWNPIWQILAYNQHILKKLPKFPWGHDCK